MSFVLHVLKFLKICINLSKILINIHWMHCDIVSWTDMFQFLYTALQVPWLMLYSIHMLCTLSIKWSAYLLWHFHVSTNYIKYDNIRCHKMCMYYFIVLSCCLLAAPLLPLFFWKFKFSKFAHAFIRILCSVPCKEYVGFITRGELWNNERPRCDIAWLHVINHLYYGFPN
jgi:hypothetical protein